MKFSTSDLTLLRIRCQKCGQHTEKVVTVLVRKDAIQCVSCGGRISLSTPTNKILIAETASSCARIGEALMKGLSLMWALAGRGGWIFALAEL
jgi:DNA-directed RNA polymerase subunit RPC12/RpoP